MQKAYDSIEQNDDPPSKHLPMPQGVNRKHHINVKFATFNVVNIRSFLENLYFSTAHKNVGFIVNLQLPVNPIFLQ
jgi:hypothetical protein